MGFRPAQTPKQADLLGTSVRASLAHLSLKLTPSLDANANPNPKPY